MTDPSTLRRRAATLRELSGRIERSPALALADHAGPDTWHSPHAELCRGILAANRAQVLRSVDELRWRADHLERRAAEREAELARLAALGVPS